MATCSPPSSPAHRIALKACLAAYLGCLLLAPPAWAAGQLVLDTDPPGASVSLDGQPIGKTPLVRNDLSEGRHDLQLSRPGFRPQALSVTIRNDLTTRRRVRMVAESRQNPGELLLETTPGGVDVYLGGRLIGQTPLRTKLPEGTHRLSLARNGYEGVSTTIRVLADLTTVQRLALVAVRPSPAPQPTRAPEPSASTNPPTTSQSSLASLSTPPPGPPVAMTPRSAPRAHARPDPGPVLARSAAPDLPPPSRRPAPDSPPEALSPRTPSVPLDSSPKPASSSKPKEERSTPRPTRVLAPEAPSLVPDTTLAPPRSERQDSPRSLRIVLPRLDWDLVAERARHAAFSLVMVGFVATLGRALWRRRPQDTWQPDLPAASFQAVLLLPGPSGREAVQATLAGIRAAGIGHGAEAIDSLQRAFDLAPCAETAFNLAVAWQQAHEPGWAEVAYRTAISLDPFFRDAAFNLAVLLVESGRPIEGLLAYRTASERLPDDGAIAFNLANLHAELGQSALAIKQFKRAARSMPGDPAPRTNLRIARVGYWRQRLGFPLRPRP